MIELGELEKNSSEFASHGVHVVVASVDTQEDSRWVQSKFPHLTVLSDPDGTLTRKFGLLHPHAGPEGKDIATPTTILVDEHGTIRWLFRPDRVITRLSPAALTAAIDQYLR